MTYATIPRRWPESTIACVASGPSLTAEDCAYLRGRVRVIAVNDGIRLTRDFADVLYSSDWKWWAHYKGYPAYTGPKYGLEVRTKAGRQRYESLACVQLLRYVGDRGLSLQPDGLASTKHSGGAAINLAVHFGARRILLLGYNLGRVRGQQHFFPKPSAITIPSPFDQFLRYLETMVAPLDAAGVEVVNCTPQSRIRYFPSMALREALPESAVAAREQAVA